MPIRLWKIALTLIVVSSVAMGTFLYLGARPSGTGSLAVAVHDAPCSDCSHVWVTFTSVAVHESNSSGSGWTTLNVTGTTIDLAALNGTAMAKVIGVLSLPAGHYEQIRLSVTKVLVDFVGGTSATAQIPNSTVDVNGAFSLASGSTTTVSIDIDLASSLHLSGGVGGAGVVFTPNIGSVVVS